MPFRVTFIYTSFTGGLEDYIIGISALIHFTRSETTWNGNIYYEATELTWLSLSL